MNIEEAAPIIDAGQPASAPSEPTPPGELSIADHEAEFPSLSRAEREAEARKARAEPKDAPADGPDAADTRDEKGRFRHRAASQKATAADVPRINELTAKLRAAEAERDALKARPSAAPALSAPPPAAPVPRVASSVPDKAPQLKDFVNALGANEVYEDALQKHAEALTEWRWQRGTQEAQQKQAEQQFYTTFQSKVKDAASHYPDFQAVAMDADSAIPPGSLMDSWVWEHPAGAHVLYHLQKNPADVSRISALPTLEQLSELSLLSQRLTAPSTRSAAAGTGSAPAPVSVIPAPRPPNPVRTGPVKAADAPLGDDASISDHEARFGSKRRRS